MRKLARRALAAGIGLAVALLGLEIGLRFLLFSDSALARRLGGSWRKAEWYADPRSEDAYWKLQYLFLDPARRSPVPGPDPSCGWMADLRPGTYDPPVAPDLRGRRPVLLYGDSYAHCTTAPSHCFPELLEQSDLGDRYAMVNLGVGGYGLDQILLLLRATIDRWKELDPIVVVSFFVDDDFHRDTLTFRSWPKRRFALEDGKLALSGPPLLPPDEFLAEHPVGIASYLGRMLVFRSGFLPPSLRARLRRPFDRREEQIELGRRILEEIHGELAARKLTHFFLLFHGWDSLQPNPTTAWADELAVDTATKLAVPWIGTRAYLLAAVGGDVALAGERLFEVRNGQYAHYDDVGNWVAFQALRSGIEGRFGEEALRPRDGLLELPPFASTDDGAATIVDTTFLGSPARAFLRGESALARAASVPYAPFDPKEREPYLLLRPGEGGPTRVTIAVPQGALRFLGTACAVGRGGSTHSPDRPADAGLSLQILVDGEAVVPIDPPAHPKATSFFVPVAGKRELELVASGGNASAAGPWIHLAGARFSWKP